MNISGWKGHQPSRKKVRWNPESGLMRWNAFSLLICFNMFWGVFLSDLCTFCLSHLPNVGLLLMKISPLKVFFAEKGKKGQEPSALPTRNNWFLIWVPVDIELLNRLNKTGSVIQGFKNLKFHILRSF